jgi:endoglucanase
MRFFFSVVLLLFFSHVKANEHWPEWDNFKSTYISPEGRVIDGSHPNLITTSEGQAYALFFSLIANDKDTFNQLLNWTKQNLASNDLETHLPAWCWGKKSGQQYQILDNNSASDADLWLAYILAEAGRLWSNQDYENLSVSIATQILEKETVFVPHYGQLILPGAQGFKLTEHSWRINPSYFPLQLFKRFSVLYPNSPWQTITQNSLTFLTQSAPQGMSPNWAVINDNGEIYPETPNNTIGGYDAIRVYLWLGMLADNDPDKNSLIQHFSPWLKMIQTDGFVSEYFDITTKMQTNHQPLGFNAAALPLLVSIDDTSTLSKLLDTLKKHQPSNTTSQYYDNVLILFGKGWLEKRYHFNKDGSLSLE